MMHGVGSGALVERERELAALDAALARAAAGEGSLHVLEGPAGIGKSRLCEELRALASERGFGVLAARGGELEQDLAYGLVRQLLERVVTVAAGDERGRLLAGPARHALPALSPSASGAGAVESGVDHGLYWLVANLAESEPRLLVIDDAHWGDHASLRFLLYLARRLEGLPVAIVVATRPAQESQHGRLLALLADEARSETLALRALTPAGAHRLVEDHLDDHIAAELAQACHEVSGGIPFFLHEIATALAEAPERSVASSAYVRTLAPRTVSRSLLLRLGRASPGAVAVAQALAVTGDGPSIPVLAAVAGILAAEVPEALEELVALTIAADTGAPALGHPIIRNAIYHDLPAARRQVLHRRAARAEADAGAGALAVSHHLLLTGPAGSPQTVATLSEGAAIAQAGGEPAAAARFLARALAEPPPGPAERTAVLAALGQAELAAERPAEAAVHLREALSGPLAPEIEVATALQLAHALSVSEGYPAAIAALEQAAAALTGDGALRLDVEATALALYLPDRAREAQQRMLEYARLPGETPAERVGLATAAIAIAFDPRSRVEDAEPVARRALGGRQLISEQTAEAPQFGNAIYVIGFAEDFDGVAEQIEYAFADARARSSAFGFVCASLGGLMLNLSRGRLPEAIAHGEAVIASWPEVSHTPVAGRWVSTAVRCLCEALLDRGEAGRARELAVEWSAAVDSEDIEFGMVRFARALVALHDLDVDAAHADFLAYGEICRQVGYEDRTTLWRLGAARAAAGRGDRDEAERLASEALEIALTWGTPGGIGTARHIHALVGDPDLCVAGLEEAIDSLAASPLRLTLAHATIDLGIALRRQGARARARTALADGMELAARCGALGVAERARGELRILGARPRRLMFSGVEALTATERRIAGLAAAGMTNRAIAHDLFVTLKTVETHLGNAYRKLGIRSRAELPAVLGAGDARRPGGPVPTPSSV